MYIFTYRQLHKVNIFFSALSFGSKSLDLVYSETNTIFFSFSRSAIFGRLQFASLGVQVHADLSDVWVFGKDKEKSDLKSQSCVFVCVMMSRCKKEVGKEREAGGASVLYVLIWRIRQ